MRKDRFNENADVTVDVRKGRSRRWGPFLLRIVEPREARVTLSLGVTTRQTKEDSSNLLERADAALYRLKGAEETEWFPPK